MFFFSSVLLSLGLLSIAHTKESHSGCPRVHRHQQRRAAPEESSLMDWYQPADEVTIFYGCPSLMFHAGMWAAA